jgi:hypothetical protein
VRPCGFHAGLAAVTGVAVLLIGVVPASAQGTPFEISDNSFLVEEALNQEPGIFQNIGTFRRSEGGDWEAGFTQEWPVLTQRHQLSFTVPVASRASETGVGDAFIHYRLQVSGGSGSALAFSPRVSLVLPSGRAARGLGNGGVGWELNLPVSKQVHDVYFHLNAGATHLPAAEVGGTRFNLLTPRLAGSAIWRARPMVNLMFETVVDWPEEVVSIVSGTTERRTTVTVVPGVRTGWDIGDSQAIVGLGVPIVSTQEERSAGVLLYFSYELPFARP